MTSECEVVGVVGALSGWVITRSHVDRFNCIFDLCDNLAPGFGDLKEDESVLAGNLGQDLLKQFVGFQGRCGCWLIQDRQYIVGTGIGAADVRRSHCCARG